MTPFFFSNLKMKNLESENERSVNKEIEIWE
jgi:hypothetical protein